MYGTINTTEYQTALNINLLAPKDYFWWYSLLKNVIYLQMSSPDPVDVAANFVKLLLEKNELLSGSNNVVLWLAGRIRLSSCCLPFVPNTVQEVPTFTKLSSLSWMSESASTVGPFVTSLDEEELELLDDLGECCKFWCRSWDDKDLEFECCDLLCTIVLPTSSCRLLCNFSFAFLLTQVKIIRLPKSMIQLYKHSYIIKDMWTNITLLQRIFHSRLESQFF